MERRVKLSLDNISKTMFSRAKANLIIDQISFDIYENEFLVILGPGQAGKTVLLNMLAGLYAPTSGAIKYEGKDLHGVDPRISMVFQKTALLPWRTVMDNVVLGPEFAGAPKKEMEKDAGRYIDLVGLKGFEKSYPRQLSGGMKQRVGIARAYCAGPEVLIMDEPFGALDAQTRYMMEDKILEIWEKDKKTIVFVTNNIEEACYLGERVILLSKCPATVKKIYDLSDFPRPRDNLDKEFMMIRQEISSNTDLPF